MKRLGAMVVLTMALGALGAGTAQAAPPVVTTPTATDVQGVSALLKSSVDPQGLPTTYYFEYSTQASFAGAAKTPVEPAGSGTGPRPARAAISGLKPSTTYFIRVTATNGTSAQAQSSFITTSGFGFLTGVSGFGARAFSNGGAAASRAGEHPYQLDLELGLRTGGEFEGEPGVAFPDGDLRNLRMEMPAGLILNPRAVTRCPLDRFGTPRSSPFEESRSGEDCPDTSQVGTVELESSLGGGDPRRFGIFNLVPTPGAPAQLGFAPYGAPIVLDENIRTNPDGTYVLTLEAEDVPQLLDTHGIRISFWGTPWAASHNGERGDCLKQARPESPWAKCSVGEPKVVIPLAYLTLPHQCSGPLAFSVSADSWQQPGTASASAVNRNASNQMVEMGSCVGLPFSPKPVGQLTDVKASSPSGYNFTLSIDNANLTDPNQRAPSPTKRMAIALPNGVTVNPSVGAGLSFCTPGQYAVETALSNQGEGCPNASKLGDFTVRSPLFEDAFKGAVYLAQPGNGTVGQENPFGTLLAVYLVARIQERGVLVKVAGRIDPDPGSGNLVATFDGLPEFPYEELSLTFRTGQRAFLVTPFSCGPAVTTADLVPWAGTGSVHQTSATQITTGVGGGPCPAGIPPFTPSINAGGVNSNVNSYTPYFVHIKRSDVEQELTSYSLDLPEGITGKLAGIPFCPEASIEAARAHDGVAETAEPSCPAASQVGRVETGYGVGSSLTYTNGRVYLAGPYNGRPLSLVVINPATVGPFDLGNVVIRSAFAVDEHTAKLEIDAGTSDRIPHILEGVVLHLRDIRIYMDRPQFIHNPSSCAPSKLISRITGAGTSFENAADDSTSTGSVHFQLLNCRTLGFKPKLGIELRGSPKRRAFPSLHVTFAARGPGDTNLKEIAVGMPKSEFLAQEHIKGICTKAQFAADSCPADSAYGSAVAYTPLFDSPLRGNVYLRAHPGHALPDLVASLYSGAIHIVLEGEIGSTKQGGLKASFGNLPDEPIDKFEMTLAGGKRGLLQNSANVCASPPLAQVKALGQTNLGSVFTSVLRGQCKKKKGKNKRSHHRGGKR